MAACILLYVKNGTSLRDSYMQAYAELYRMGVFRFEEATHPFVFYSLCSETAVISNFGKHILKHISTSIAWHIFAELDYLLSNYPLTYNARLWIDSVMHHIAATHVPKGPGAHVDIDTLHLLRGTDVNVDTNIPEGPI